MDSFYLTLPCKRFNDTNPADKPENYVTNLPQSFNLENEWEVGLKEITFPKSWSNVPFNQKIDIIFYDRNKSIFFNVLSLDEVFLEAGNYEIDEMIDEINKNIEKYIHSHGGDDDNNNELKNLKGFPDKLVTKVPLIKYNKIKNAIEQIPGVINEREHFFVRFDKLLGNILGFDYGEMNLYFIDKYSAYNNLQMKTSLAPLPKIQDTSVIESFKTFNMNDGIRHLFITSNICKESIYGQVLKNILKIVEIPDTYKYGNQYSAIYDCPHYVPLKSNTFDKVDIKIYDYLNFKASDTETENLLPFDFGLLIITLHLRKKINLLALEPINREETDDRNIPERHPLDERGN